MTAETRIEGFDLRTHIRDHKGNIIEVRPYKLHASKARGWWYERDGKKFAENGKPLDFDEVADAEAQLKLMQDKVTALKQQASGVLAVETKVEAKTKAKAQ